MTDPDTFGCLRPLTEKFRGKKNIPASHGIWLEKETKLPLTADHLHCQYSNIKCKLLLVFVVYYNLLIESNTCTAPQKSCRVFIINVDCTLICVPQISISSIGKVFTIENKAKHFSVMHDCTDCIPTNRQHDMKGKSPDVIFTIVLHLLMVFKNNIWQKWGARML